MKKIGFIDYYIDEAHANRYPKMIRELPGFKGKFDVVLAWEEITMPGKKRIDEWCREQKIKQAPDIATVVDQCDCIVVLSPDNAERHEDLADLPLRSGKPVYIDKPIAPSLAAARRLFDKARKYGTPMMSCSALRFGSELEAACRDKLAGQKIDFVATRGGAEFHNYAIHQLEMIVMTLGVGARRVMQCGRNRNVVMVIDYDDDRRGFIHLVPDYPAFQLVAQFGNDKSLAIDTMNDFFPRFMNAMLAFLDTGKSPVPERETLEIAALIEAGHSALKIPDTWTPVPQV